MIEVIVVCEGQTEETFVRNVLATPLADRNVIVQPRLITTSPSGKGGALSRDRIVRYLRNTLRERGDVYVATLFDLHGLKTDFPGRSDAVRLSDPIERAVAIEGTFHQVVVQEAGCRQDRFLPHIQPYEFEALLFADVTQFAEVNSAWQPAVEVLKAVRQLAQSPEHINDGQDTHPSARLEKGLPRYQKVLHGSAVAAQIGLDQIRAECRHFGEWLTRIESLQPLRIGE